MNCKIVNFKKKKWPKYARFAHGCVMRKRLDDSVGSVYYYRDAGCWGVWVQCIKGKIMITDPSMDVVHLLGDQLFEATEKEYEDDNWGYTKKNPEHIL